MSGRIIKGKTLSRKKQVEPSTSTDTTSRPLFETGKWYKVKSRSKAYKKVHRVCGNGSEIEFLESIHMGKYNKRKSIGIYPTFDLQSTDQSKVEKYLPSSAKTSSPSGSIKSGFSKDTKTVPFNSLKVGDRIKALVDYPEGGAVKAGEVGTIKKTHFVFGEIIVDFPSQHGYCSTETHWDKYSLVSRAVEKSTESVKPAGSIRKGSLKKTSKQEQLEEALVDEAKEYPLTEKDSLVKPKAIAIDIKRFKVDRWYLFRGIYVRLSEAINSTHLESTDFPFNARISEKGEITFGKGHLVVEAEEWNTIEEITSRFIADKLIEALNLQSSLFYKSTAFGTSLWVSFKGINSNGHWLYDKYSKDGLHYITAPYDRTIVNWVNKLHARPLERNTITQDPKEVQVANLSFDSNKWYVGSFGENTYYIKPIHYDGNTPRLSCEYICKYSNGKWGTYQASVQVQNKDLLLSLTPISDISDIVGKLPVMHPDAAKPLPDIKPGKWYKVINMSSAFYMKVTHITLHENGLSIKTLHGEKYNPITNQYYPKGDWSNPEFFQTATEVTNLEEIQHFLPKGHVDSTKVAIPDVKTGIWYRLLSTLFDDRVFYMKFNDLSINGKQSVGYGECIDVNGKYFKPAGASYASLLTAIEVPLGGLTFREEILPKLPEGHPDNPKKEEKTMETKGSIKSGFSKSKPKGSIKSDFSKKRTKSEEVEDLDDWEDFGESDAGAEHQKVPAKREFQVDLPVHSSEGFDINDIVRIVKNPGKAIAGYESEWSKPMEDQIGKELRVMRITPGAIWLSDGYRYPSCALEIIKPAVPKHIGKVVKLNTKSDEEESSIAGTIRRGTLSPKKNTPSPEKEMHGESTYSRKRRQVTPIKQIPLKGY